MADTTALKNRIRAAIKANDNQEITGPILQQTLLDIVDELDLNPELENEASLRQQGDTQLGNLINGIKDNIDNGYVYTGIATPSTVPVGGKVFYMAVQAGTYTNFGDIAVAEGITILKYNGTLWVKEQVLFTDGGVFDISAYNLTNGQPTLYSNLAAALGINGVNVPDALHKSGISVKFLRGSAQSSDNKYVQYRLMADEWSTNTDDWAIADEGVYVENPEFLYVKTDADEKVLWGIKKDGSVYYGTGCPPQVKAYVQSQIDSIGIGAILATLATKVDKVTGKSLINSDFALSQDTIESQEFIDVKTDANEKVIEAITINGRKQINIPVDTPSVSIESVDNSEWLEVKTDSEGKRIIEGIRKNGKKYT